MPALSVQVLPFASKGSHGNGGDDPLVGELLTRPAKSGRCGLDKSSGCGKNPLLSSSEELEASCIEEFLKSNFLHK
jgi:hypothetical protein